MLAWPIVQYALYIIPGIVVLEILYLYIRYMHAGPLARSRIIEEFWGYVFTWIVIVAILAVYEDRNTLTGIIGSSLGIKPVKPDTRLLLDGLTSTVASWVGFWGIVEVLKALGTTDTPVLAGVSSALADLMEKSLSLLWQATGYFIIDLAILYVLTLYVEAMNVIWPAIAGLILPRSTRRIGATLMAYYLILLITLPVMYGIVMREWGYVMPISPPIPCNINLSDIITALSSSNFINILSNIGTCIADWLRPGISLIMNIFGGGMINAYYAFILDIELTLAYILTWLFSYWLATLIDIGAFRLLESIK